MNYLDEMVHQVAGGCLIIMMICITAASLVGVAYLLRATWKWWKR